MVGPDKGERDADYDSEILHPFRALHGELRKIFNYKDDFVRRQRALLADLNITGGVSTVREGHPKRWHGVKNLVSGKRRPLENGLATL